MIESLMRMLENASGRSIGMVMAVIGVVVWWVASRIKMGVGQLKGDNVSLKDDVGEPEPERPRRRLSLRAYHR